MQRGLARTGLTGSALVDRLARMGLAHGLLDGPYGSHGPQVASGAGNPPARPAPPSFVDGLERWLGWTDAIALATALQTAGPNAGRPAGQPIGQANGVNGTNGAQVSRGATDAVGRAQQALARVQTRLARAIETDALGAPHATHATEAANASLAPLRRRAELLQRQMDTAIAALRGQVREAVAGLSPALARLAAIDAVLHGALQAREHTLLARLPGQLEGLAERLPDGEQGADRLRRVREDLRQLLLDELALRLQPVQGLLAAATGAAAGAHHHTTGHA